MRRVKTTVPYEECKVRVMRSLSPATPMCASSVAEKIWPEAQFLNAQGAGAAASRILKRMEKENLVKWISNKAGWGWVRFP
jgi:hypothetical protein